MNKFIFESSERFISCMRLSQTPWCNDKNVKNLLRNMHQIQKRIYLFKEEQIHFQNDNLNFFTNEI